MDLSLLLGTYNQGKAVEISNVLRDLGIKLLTLRAFPQAQPVKESGATYEENAILKAEGYGQALQTVFASAQLIDSKTMTLQVIDGLKALGASPSSKFVIPMEFTKLLGQVGQYLDNSLQSSTDVPSAHVNGEVQGALEPAGRP